MDIQSNIREFLECVSWPYHGDRGGLVLVAIAVASLALLIVAAKAQGKSQD